MKHRIPLLIPTVVLFASSPPALAQFRCDCTRVVDSCEADVAVRGNWVEITTDHRQCARVDYFLDGQPFVSVVVDGRDRQDWIPRTTEPRVLVQSCQVCSDAGSAPAGGEALQSAQAAQTATRGVARGAAAEQAEERQLEPLIEVPPEYPATAQPRGIGGSVELEVTVGPSGDVQDAAVTSAQPPGVFDQAALAAITRWRYPAESGREPQTVIERMTFRPQSEGSQTRIAEPVASAPRPSAEGARNQCVRENSVFNYGEMIEVDLMNACDTPILVFGCAEGTGRYTGRWICTTSEQQRTVLVRPGDARIGNTTPLNMPAGTSPAAFTDSFFVSRAPNSEYWWLVCGIEDDACRENAREWTRSLDKQLASVDPQARSSAAVARSY